MIMIYYYDFTIKTKMGFKEQGTVKLFIINQQFAIIFQQQGIGMLKEFWRMYLKSKSQLDLIQVGYTAVVIILFFTVISEK